MGGAQATTTDEVAGACTANPTAAPCPTAARTASESIEKPNPRACIIESVTFDYFAILTKTVPEPQSWP